MSVQSLLRLHVSLLRYKSALLTSLHVHIFIRARAAHVFTRALVLGSTLASKSCFRCLLRAEGKKHIQDKV